MKVVYLITGSGGSFYCGNCYRDMIYLRAIRKTPGTKASAIPLYLPPDITDSNDGLDHNVFFGAISMYIRGKVPFLRDMPVLFDKILDSPAMLRMAAKRAGTTRTEGMEEMTINMISGKDAFPEKELERLSDYISREGKPDIIHLSNALIIGLAGRIKSRIDTKIVCSLLNEDDWLNEMPEPWQSKAWSKIAEGSCNIDSFITPSEYYKAFFSSKTGISEDKIHVVPLAVDYQSISEIKKNGNFPSLGYLCRVNSSNGFDKLIDAFIRLRSGNRVPGLTLHVSGGYTSDDKPFIKRQMRKIRKAGLNDAVKIYTGFSGEDKAEFFSNIDVLSVPVRKYDGYGLYLLEANAAGIPVVQPSTGAFPEIIRSTGGGVVYEPDDIESLASAIEGIFSDKMLLTSLADAGRKTVKEKLSIDVMAAGLSGVYNKMY